MKTSSIFISKLGFLLFLALNFGFAQTSFNISSKTTGDTLLTIDNNGNVGIGTTVPQTMVDVRSSDPDMGGQLRLGNQDLTHYLRLYGGRLNNPNPFILWNPGDALRFGTAFSQELMRLSDTGNLGLGIIDPTARLDIGMTGTGPWQRAMRVLNPDMVTDDALLMVLGRSDDSRNMGYMSFKYFEDDSDLNRLTLGLYGVNHVLNITGAGNVGIGTAAPTEMLEVADTIYSSVGGFKFPDQTVQTTAFTAGGGNTLDQAYDQGGAGAGRTITADAGAVTVSGVDGFLAGGIYNSGSIPATGAGTRMMWYPRKSAFRAGNVSGIQWDDANIGGRSIALGNNATASGASSVAMGDYPTASGFASTAIGRFATASGDNSTALGVTSSAEGQGSTAMGMGTTASGTASTSMGSNTIASGNNSTAIGEGIEVSGDHSMAIALSDQTDVIVSQDTTLSIMGGNVGIGTISPSVKLEVADTISSTFGGFMFPDGSVQETAAGAGLGNTLDQAYDQGGTGVGRTIVADAGAFTVAGVDGFLSTGTYGSGTIPVEGEGTRMMWYPRRSAFRVGRLSSIGRDYWNADSIGAWSVAMGTDTRAKGSNSVAMGWNTIAGENGSTAMGYGTSATGVTSTALGNVTKASGQYSTSMGLFTEASGDASTAMGHSTEASGHYSTAMGYGTSASGSRSTALGYQTTASSSYATAMGYNTVASDIYATAMGNNTEASGSSSTALGYQTTASNQYSTAMGNNTEASGSSSTALGYQTTASGSYSTAMGYNTVSSHNYATAMGNNTEAGGQASTAIGSYVSTDFYAAGSFIIGDNSTTTTSTVATTDRFTARFANGYRLYTNSTLTSGAEMLAGANSWSTISDSTKKENFKSIDGEDLLNKISKFRLTSWNYKGQDPAQFRHYGPMAQDFYAAFGNDGIGTIGNDTTIASADFDGVNFIAIQALEKRTRELKSENEKLKSELELLRSKISQFESVLQKMEKLSAINSNSNKKEYAHSN